jgi:hypothetical protein
VNWKPKEGTSEEKFVKRARGQNKKSSEAEKCARPLEERGTEIGKRERERETHRFF